MSDDKFKGYDFDGDDPFDDDPFSSGGLSDEDNTSAELGEGDAAPTAASDDANAALSKTEQAVPQSPPQKKAKAKGSAGIMEFVKDNWILGVGGVVVLGVGWYMYGMIFPSAPSRPQQQAQRPAPQQKGFGLTSKPVKVPQKAQSAPAAPAGSDAVAKKPQVQTQPQPQDSVTITRTDLEKMVKGFTKIVQDNNKNLVSQINSISTAEQSISKLSEKDAASAKSALDAQNKVLKSLSTDIDSVKKQLQANNKNMQAITKSMIRTQTQLRVLLAQKSQSRDHLSLRAVVPGRAWLVDKAGKTLTIAVGDKIKNYGTVEKVDSKNAQVIMSSGYVFN